MPARIKKNLLAWGVNTAVIRLLYCYSFQALIKILDIGLELLKIILSKTFEA